MDLFFLAKQTSITLVYPNFAKREDAYETHTTSPLSCTTKEKQLAISCSRTAPHRKIEHMLAANPQAKCLYIKRARRRGHYHRHYTSTNRDISASPHAHPSTRISLSIPLPSSHSILSNSRFPRLAAADRPAGCSHGRRRRRLPVALAGAPRRARQGRRVRARPGAGLPHPPQLVRRLLQGRQAQVPQLPAHAVHERQARARAALRRARRHR